MYKLIIDVCDFNNVPKSTTDNVLYSLKRICFTKERISDLIVILNANKYVMHYISKQEWTKYYFHSKRYAKTKKLEKCHLILSKWDFIKNETFGNPETHIADVKIPMNNIPIRCEYEDNFNINIEELTIIVSQTTNSSELQNLNSSELQNLNSSELQNLNSSELQNWDSEEFENMISNSKENTLQPFLDGVAKTRPNVFLIGDQSTLKPENVIQCISELWKLESCTNDRGIFHHIFYLDI